VTPFTNSNHQSSQVQGKSFFFKSSIPRPSHHLHNAMVTKLNPASKEKLIKQGKLAVSARAHKQRCYEVTFDGVEPGEYVLMDPPENLRWKEDGFDWQQVHSSAWQEDKYKSHYYRIFRKCESMCVVLLCWSDPIRQQGVSLFPTINAAHIV
jgi:hypothetical protein